MKKIIYTLALLIIFSSAVPAHSATTEAHSWSQLFKTKDVNSSKSIEHLVGNVKNEVKIIFSDIDGTILSFDARTSKTPIPRKVKCSVKKLQKNKIPLILITGRSYFEAKDIANGMDYSYDYIVSLQGAEIHNAKGELIYKDLIKDEDTGKILDYIETIENNNKIQLKTYLFSNGSFYSNTKEVPIYNWQSLTTLNSLKNIGPKFSCAKIIVYEEDQQKRSLVQSELKKKFPDYNVDLAGAGYCDINAKTATKGNAVKKLSKILGINLENVAVLGDAENDLSMINAVKTSGGLTIATGNAMDSVKQSANYITFPVTQCGFSKAIDEIIKNNKKLKK